MGEDESNARETRSSPADEQVTSAISLYDAAAAWNGGWMTESAYSSIHGAEISERSTELVLPSSPAAASRGDLDDSSAASAHSALSALPSETGSEMDAWRRAPLVHTAEPAQSAQPTDPNTSQRGFALPGDRGPRDVHREHEAGSQRPSFWRRIALGRRSQTIRSAQLDGTADLDPLAGTPRMLGDNGAGLAGSGIEVVPTGGTDRTLAPRDANDLIAARASAAAERRIVEPLLQALVSVEAKLERSHVDLVGRSDQVEQRLTQLWDIEEQLGALGELQESVLQVTEQQRRLEAALVAQTRILRWLVGGIILSLAVAAFSVSFFLRVSS